MWLDIACIVFVCVTVNHLGLVSAIEDVTGRKLRIINCPKCFCHWAVFLYAVFHFDNMIAVFAISLLCAYIATWLELFEGFIDSLFMKLYEKVYSESEHSETATAADGDSPDSTLSELRKDTKAHSSEREEMTN